MAIDGNAVEAMPGLTVHLEMKTAVGQRVEGDVLRPGEQFIPLAGLTARPASA
jgi:hypothetical protein